MFNAFHSWVCDDAATVANVSAVPVNVVGEITSIVAASVASSSSAATKSSKKAKLSAAVAIPAAMVDRTGDAMLPPAPDLFTTALKKSSKKRGDHFAAVEHGATDASIPSKPRYPSRGIPDRNASTAVGASSHPVAEDDADPIIPAEKTPHCCGEVEIVSLILFQCYEFVLLFCVWIHIHEFV
jgi:hypothetical protein